MGANSHDIDYGYCESDFNNPRNNRLHTATAGYQRLIMATALDAFVCLRAHDLEVRREAEAWVASDEYLVFSYRTFCDVFELDPEYMRAMLTKRRHQESISVSLQQHLRELKHDKDMQTIAREESDYLEQFEEPEGDSDF